jgi:hypothetical protein
MDDCKNSTPANRCLMRQCEASRLQGQLLAQAYQQVFPQARQSLTQAKADSPPVNGLPPQHKAAVMAAGA